MRSTLGKFLGTLVGLFREGGHLLDGEASMETQIRISLDEIERSREVTTRAYDQDKNCDDCLPGCMLIVLS